MWPRLQIPKTHTEKGFACSSFSLGRSLDELRSPNSLAMVHSWIGSFSGHLAAQFQIRERLYLKVRGNHKQELHKETSALQPNDAYQRYRCRTHTHTYYTEKLTTRQHLGMHSWTHQQAGKEKLLFIRSLQYTVPVLSNS